MTETLIQVLEAAKAEEVNFEYTGLKRAIEIVKNHSQREIRGDRLLIAALRTIERWDWFPDTNRTWDDGTPMSYSAAYGSNGERDYMRKIARDALAALSEAQGSDIPAMPKELREPFEDYYSGVADHIQRRAAQWGFECGVMHAGGLLKRESSYAPNLTAREVEIIIGRAICSAEKTPISDRIMKALRAAGMQFKTE